jgi:hypothetical protein
VKSQRDMTLIKLYKSIVNKEIGNKSSLGHESLHELLRFCNKTVFVEESLLADYMLVDLQGLEGTKRYYKGLEYLFILSPCRGLSPRLEEIDFHGD